MEVESIIKQSLKDFFGFNSFKGEQEEIINSITEGKDTFVVMPTGGGKSLCYQLPAIAKEGTAIIISPLIALMKNQVDHIRAYSNETGIAHFINSSLTRKAIRQVKEDIVEGKTKMLYVAPESLTKDETVKFLQKTNVSFVAVDEAHCISEWGHDFRPEYRRIREIVNSIGSVPVIALTASATPKVKLDIIKNLQMISPAVYQSSFNRPNLYYEIRPKFSKTQALKDIIGYIKQRQGKSGIVYCLSRKTVEEVAESLRVNGIIALEYHAGMDSATRNKHQDKFLMEEADVIVATIAFGMGIDKPDVRFVIHFDVPKSLESYYQETGRAGRDDISSDCILFYNYNDLIKLEKFLKDKPVSEREVGTHLLKEMAGFCESSVCRRKILLHYFGESFKEEKCSKMCDNCRDPKEKFDGNKEIEVILKTVLELDDKFTLNHIVDVIRGQKNQGTISYGHDKLRHFGKGESHDFHFWKSIVKQTLYYEFLEKDIEHYGTLKLSKKGLDYLREPFPVNVAIDQNFEDMKPTASQEPEGGSGYDETLFKMLRDLRKKLAKDKNLPPYIIFQDPSLEEMAIKYPINEKEITQISGVSHSKAVRYGKPFVELISKYVEDNEIDRPDDIIVKSIANKSKMKIFIIQNIDRKVNLNDICDSKGITMDELLNEIEHIVYSGTRINIDYYIDEVLDAEYQDELFDYFRNAESDSLSKAIDEFGEDVYSKEEIQLMRIKFVSEMGN